MKLRQATLFILAILLLTSCSSTHIVLANNKKPYQIYINNQLKGTGTASIPRSGLPQTRTIQVRDASGNVLAQERIRREMNVLKFVGGFIYLFPLWFFAWDYDKEISIFIPKQTSDEFDAQPSKSKWD